MPDTPLMDSVVSRTVERRLPFNAHVDLTYRCNERCIHCYLEHDDYGEMTTAEVKDVLDQLAEAGTLFLTFSGGEVFLRKDFFELVEYARSLHFDLSLKTNALLVTEERAKRLRALGVRRVQVSIYSDDPAVHDAITKIPGSLQRTLEGLRLFQEQGMQVKIACPLMKQNLNAARGVRALAERLGIPYILDLTITPMIDGDRKTLDLRLSTEELLPVMRDPDFNPKMNAMEAERSKSGVVMGSVTSSGVELDGSAYDNIICSAGHNSCYISPYGDVYPCVQMPVPTGNVRRERFTDIWYGSAKMREVREVRESQLEICGECSIRAHCERCPGLAEMEGGNMLGAYERACELAELNARLAGVPHPVSRLHELQKMGRAPLRHTSRGLVQIAKIGLNQLTPAWGRTDGARA